MSLGRILCGLLCRFLCRLDGVLAFLRDHDRGKGLCLATLRCAVFGMVVIVLPYRVEMAVCIYGLANARYVAKYLIEPKSFFYNATPGVK